MQIEALYKAYADDVYRFACWLTGNAADAEDITSETFVRAWTSAAPIRTATARAYVLRIARNLCIQQHRLARPGAPLGEDLIDPTPSPDRVLQGEMEFAAAVGALMQLPEQDRSALLLRAEHDLPYDEIARVLGVSAGAARVRVHRARLRLARARDHESTPNGEQS